MPTPPPGGLCYGELLGSQCGVISGNGDAQLLTVGHVGLLGCSGSEFHRHGGDVGLTGEDLSSHLTGDLAQLVVVDGERRHAAAPADAGLACDDGGAGG